MPWYAKLVELATVTVCVIAVLLVTAHDPSYDEIGKGLVAGVVAYFTSRFRLPPETQSES